MKIKKIPHKSQADQTKLKRLLKSYLKMRICISGAKVGKKERDRMYRLLCAEHGCE